MARWMREPISSKTAWRKTRRGVSNRFLLNKRFGLSRMWLAKQVLGINFQIAIVIRIV
jgi:hypothetical protein